MVALNARAGAAVASRFLSGVVWCGRGPPTLSSGGLGGVFCAFLCALGRFGPRSGSRCPVVFIPWPESGEKFPLETCASRRTGAKARSRSTSLGEYQPSSLCVRSSVSCNLAAPFRSSQSGPSRRSARPRQTAGPWRPSSARRLASRPYSNRVHASPAHRPEAPRGIMESPGARERARRGARAADRPGLLSDGISTGPPRHQR